VGGRDRSCSFGDSFAIARDGAGAAADLPSAGAYKAIPNFTGSGAGADFRNAINDRFSGVAPTSPRIVSSPFAGFGAETDGALIYCSDCKATIPCVAGGSGAWAFGAQGQWECAAPGTIAQGSAATLDVNGVENPLNHGVVLDAVSATDLTFTNGSKVVTSSSPHWSSANLHDIFIGNTTSALGR